jgi:16S rRNA G1207 methylase RsmC
MTNTKTAAKGISILVHWTQSTRETEDMAATLYDNLATAQDIVIGGKKVNYIQLLHNESIDVGADENGICERVIEFIIYYERS